jgi:hypothetical protein
MPQMPESHQRATGGQGTGWLRLTGFEEDFFSFDEDESDGYEASDKPFDFVEEEGKTALLCESDPMIKKAITRCWMFSNTTSQRSKTAVKP